MKVFIWFMMIGLLACSGQDGYRISGVFSGYWRVQVYLIAEKNGGRDTLAVAKDVNGRFELSGKVSRKSPVYIEVVADGNSKILGRIDFMLENSAYMVYVYTDSSANLVLNEHKDQELAHQFYTNEEKLIEGRERFINEYVKVDEVKRDSLGKEFKRLIGEYEKQETTLVQMNPDSYVSAVMLIRGISNYISGVRKFDFSLGNHVHPSEFELQEWERIKECYALLTDNVKNKLRRNKVEEYMAKVEEKMKTLKKVLKMSEGAIAPDFTSISSEGNAFSLYGVKGKLKLVHFWSSYCGPCRIENRHLVDLYRSFHQKGFEIISISCDAKKENWLKAIAEDKLPWKHHGSDRNEKGSIADSYGFSALPSTLLVDENNRIIGRNLSIKRLEEQLKERLK
ncbi:TlpA disulfide reductase family protein [Sanguibacteroides justesenii]|uniref:Thioredoxin domain-containing protein n=1 Tax=Sanguibacteroides justesenii TaxID=1547597 RepID=A0AB34R0Z2_9PORP|nr:TlpA disulfide reductase family protein [Sanguibacteroides justesenii]KIO43478.1 hypothetical protein IE90_10100 [Sanguibacteroides justesenii]